MNEEQKRLIEYHANKLADLIDSTHVRVTPFVMIKVLEYLYYRLKALEKAQ